MEYARAIVTELRGHQVRAALDPGTDKINGKILRAEESKVHTMLVIGGREKDANSVALRVHGKGSLGVKPRNEVLADIVASIRERRA